MLPLQAQCQTGQSVYLQSAQEGTSQTYTVHQSDDKDEESIIIPCPVVWFVRYSDCSGLEMDLKSRLKRLRRRLSRLPGFILYFAAAVFPFSFTASLTLLSYVILCPLLLSPSLPCLLLLNLLFLFPPFPLSLLFPPLPPLLLLSLRHL
jgi:hypothetical protein